MKHSIDESTREVLNRFKGQIPVPVVAIANALNAQVYESSSLVDMVSGYIKKSVMGDGYDIVINGKHSLRRKRFTIAHEIAHLILHRNVIDAGDLEQDFVKRPVLARRRGQHGGIEQSADSLAADILMPEDAFLNQWKMSTDVEMIADYFEVSQAAATVRATKLACETTF